MTDGQTNGRTDGQNCDGYDALKAVAAFARKKVKNVFFIFVVQIALYSPSRSVYSLENNKIIVTKSRLLKLKCNRFDFGWGFAQDPAGGAHSAPPNLLGAFRGLTSKEKEGKKEKKEREKKQNKRDECGRGREEKKRRSPIHVSQFLATPLKKGGEGDGKEKNGKGEKLMGERGGEGVRVGGKVASWR